MSNDVGNCWNIKLMSKSQKKIAIVPVTNAESDKKSKQAANRKFRRKTKIQVSKGEEIVNELREVSDVWTFEKDGKQLLKNPTNKDLRK